MENSTEVTYEMVVEWGNTHVLAAKMKDPALRPLIDEALRKKSEAVAAQLTDQNVRLDEIETARAQRRQQIAEEREKAQRDREAEVVRLSRMTPAERQVEYDAQTAAAAEAERAEAAKVIADEKDAAYLSTLAPSERKTELDRREAERIAAEEAEKNAADAAQKEIDDKAVADKAAADKVAADAVAAAEAAKAPVQTEAEKKALEDAERIAAEEKSKPKQKIVREYQVRDEEGNAIGRPTHLEADSWEEMSDKQEAAHVNAMRYVERMRKRKTIEQAEKEPEPIKLPTDEELLEAVKNLDEKDPAKRLEAIKKIASADTLKANAEADKKIAYANGQIATTKFLQNHLHDYFNCEANTKLLTDYIHENKLRWTYENLEMAFIDNELKWAKPVPQEPIPVADPEPKPVAAKEITQDPPVVNTTPAPAPVVAPVAVPAAVAPTPAEAPTTVDNTPVPARKLPAGGIEPGSLHGGRGTGSSKPSGLTKQDVARMTNTAEGRIQFRRKLKDPNFVKQLNAIGIKA